MALNPPETRSESPFSAIREAMKLMFARPTVMGWTAIPAVVLFCLIFGVYGAAIYFGVVSDEVAIGSSEWWAIEAAIIAAFGLLFYPAWAGIYAIAFALINGEPVESRSFVSFLPHYWRIVVFGLAIDTAYLGLDYLGDLALGNLYSDYLSIAVSTVVTAPLMFALAFIVRHGDTVPSAVKRSAQLFFSDPWRLFAVMIVAMVLAAAGFLALCVGALLTLPLYSTIIAILAERARPLSRQESVWPSPYPRPRPRSPYP